MHQEGALAAAVLAEVNDVGLSCWDHQRIPGIGAAHLLMSTKQLPAWPEDRFDVIRSSTPQPTLAPNQYMFSQIPQRLPGGDDDVVF